MNKAQQVLSLFVFDEDFTTSSDDETSKNNKRARASKLGWKKHRNKYMSGIDRNIRQTELFYGRNNFLAQLRRRIKKVKNAIRQKKAREESKQKYLDRFKYNLFDSKID